MIRQIVLVLEEMEDVEEGRRVYTLIQIGPEEHFFALNIARKQVENMISTSIMMCWNFPKSYSMEFIQHHSRLKFNRSHYLQIDELGNWRFRVFEKKDRKKIQTIVKIRDRNDTTV